MKSLKKSVLFVLMVMLAATFTLVPAQAQNSIRSVDVPFDFVAGTKVLKAGNYRIKREGPVFIVLTSNDGKSTQFALTIPSDKFEDHNGNPYLVFERYGSEAFLRTVAFSQDSTFELLLSKREKQHIKDMEAGEEVSLLVQPSL